MTIPKRMLSLLLVAAIAVVASSCVESKHPLSDENTSKIDERLIGNWQDNENSTYRVTKSAGTKNALDVDWKEKDAKNSGTLLVFTTTVKGKNYMSVKSLDKEEQKDRKGAFDIYQYRVVDANTIEVRGMIEDVPRKAIAAKTLAGAIDADKVPAITDEAKNIASFLETHSDECFPVKTDYMLTMKRQK